MRYLFICNFFLILICLFARDVYADKAINPDGWPWRGVSINFPSGNVDTLKRYVDELHINFVRLNVNLKLYSKVRKKDQTLAFNDALSWVNAMLDECNRFGIHASVEINKFPLDSSSRLDSHTREFWENNEAVTEIINVAGLLAKQLNQRGPELAAYQILSEPLIYDNGKALSPPNWESILQKIVSEIRIYDKQRWIIVAPGPGGGPSGYNHFNPPVDDYLIWGAHMYLPHAFTHQGIGQKRPIGIKYPGKIGLFKKNWNKNALQHALAPLFQFQNNNPRPVFIGEFSAVRWSEGGEHYIRDLVAIFNQYNWGWAYFSASGWHGWNPDYSQTYPENGTNKSWNAHFIGSNSLRWKTLREIFNSNRAVQQY